MEHHQCNITQANVICLSMVHYHKTQYNVIKRTCDTIWHNIMFLHNYSIYRCTYSIYIEHNYIYSSTFTRIQSTFSMPEACLNPIRSPSRRSTPHFHLSTFCTCPVGEQKIKLSPSWKCSVPCAMNWFRPNFRNGTTIFPSFGGFLNLGYPQNHPKLDHFSIKANW